MHLGKKIAVTGSSSLGLKDKIKEAATGRLIEYKLLPFSIRELVNNSSAIEEKKLLSQRLIYGMYPEAVTAKDDARRILLGVADSYLYKDLFSFGLIKKPNIIQRLVTALALQIGSEVSYNELAGLLGIDKVTVMNYIDLLEKCFIVFSIPSLSRNARNELKRGKKIYFYDNGIRNAVISNFANLDLRNDVGALWENFMVSELIKRNYYSNGYSKFYFWRTLSQQEIDFVEEVDGTFKAFEFKWNPKKRNAKMPKAFADAYPGTEFNVIHPDNYLDFLA
jgi:predicted AAA+ superfamily ATPase